MLTVGIVLGVGLLGCADKAPPPNWPDPPPPLLAEPIGRGDGVAGAGAGGEPGGSNGKAELVPAVEPESDRLFGDSPRDRDAARAAEGEPAAPPDEDPGVDAPADPEADPGELKERVPDDTGNGNGSNEAKASPKPNETAPRADSAPSKETP